MMVLVAKVEVPRLKRKQNYALISLFSTDVCVCNITLLLSSCVALSFIATVVPPYLVFPNVGHEWIKS
jgi:hypothetical protein